MVGEDKCMSDGNTSQRDNITTREVPSATCVDGDKGPFWLEDEKGFA